MSYIQNNLYKEIQEIKTQLKYLKEEITNIKENQTHIQEELLKINTKLDKDCISTSKLLFEKYRKLKNDFIEFKQTVYSYVYNSVNRIATFGILSFLIIIVLLYFILK